MIWGTSTTCIAAEAGALEVPMSTHSRQQSLEYNQHIFHPELLHCKPTWESASGFRCRQEPSETAVASFACDIATCLHPCPGLHPETIQFNWKEAVRLNSIHLPHTHTLRKLIRFQACFIFFERFFWFQNLRHGKVCALRPVHVTLSCEKLGTTTK